MANFCFQDGRFAHSKLLFRNVKKFFTFIFCFFADVARQNFMYTRFSFTAVVAFGDENLFAVVSWRKSGIYFIGHLLQIKSFQYVFVTITGVVCCRKLFYSKESRRESAFTSYKIVLMCLL